MNTSFKLSVIGLAVSLSACGALDTDKVDYRSASTVKAPTLEVPPDLTQLSKNTHYAVVGDAVYASDQKKAGQQAAKNEPAIAALAVGDVRIERVGNQRWLVVPRAPDQLWNPIKEFWQTNGFTLVTDQGQLGIMETEWAENRAKLPQDFIRSTLGKLLDSLYSTGERDKFRTRLERNAKGETEIFISHRGMEEVVTKDSTVWQPRATDPELESEFLRRLMVKLGTPVADAAAQVAQTGSAKPTAVIVTDTAQSPQPFLQLEEGFDNAWRRVGATLDRTGFAVEDRDRKKGIYFVRYAVPADKSKKGFFAQMFSSDEPDVNDVIKLQIAVRSEGNVSKVTVLNEKGEPATPATIQNVLKTLVGDMR